MGHKKINYTLTLMVINYFLLNYDLWIVCIKLKISFRYSIHNHSKNKLLTSLILGASGHLYYFLVSIISVFDSEFVSLGQKELNFL